MIRFVKGNLLESDAQVLVNTVNTVGVMGKGIALQFKEAYPNNYLKYRKACKNNEVCVGKMFVTYDLSLYKGEKSLLISLQRLLGESLQNIHILEKDLWICVNK